MQLVHDQPGRMRIRFASGFDARLHGSFPESLPDRIKGVRNARSNPRACSLAVRYDGGSATRKAVLDLLRRTPPALRVRSLESSETAGHLTMALLSGTILTAGTVLPPSWRLAVTWVIAASPILTGLGAVLRKGLSVEVLDGAAIGISMFRGDPGTAAATLTLTHTGEYLEATTARSSSDMLRRMLARPPGNAWLETAEGQLVEVSSGTLKPNDIVVVGPGDMIPVDGQIVSGSATINDASITGESVPVDREAGARVLSGGVVEQGRVRIRATHTGNATTMARISSFIEAAMDKKPEIQTAAERLADQRVMFTLGLGALTFALTRNPDRLASVFLVDYSCALKLGAPVAIKAALYRAAQAGILIKGGPGLEAMAGIDTIVFDKTGTLTSGNLDVTDVIPLDGQSTGDDLLALLASLEEHATHPVAEAIVAEARRHSLDHVHHDDVEFIVAHGLVSEVHGDRIAVGSRHFLEEHEDVSHAPFLEISERLEAEGKIQLFVARNGVASGIIGLRDHPRPEAAATIARLRQAGVRTIAILTGDRQEKAEALARQLKVDLVFADQKPEDKASVVNRLQAEGRKVAFVGDGVNDAPALTAADVGIAMPRGADLARATADVILLQDHVEGVADCRELANQTVALIRSNFRWAVALNSMLFVAAMLGKASPVTAAMLHNGVTLGTLVRAMAGPKAKRTHKSRG